MIARASQADPKLASLYLDDETAWLDAMSELVRAGRVDELDLPNLAECLHDMGVSQRHEVESRMLVLIAHLLKWDHQPKKRSRSWRATVIEQRIQLRRHALRGVLRKHGEGKLAEVYPEAVELAAAQTGLPPSRFPRDCPYTFDHLLTVELPEAGA